MAMDLDDIRISVPLHLAKLTVGNHPRLSPYSQTKYQIQTQTLL